MDYLILVLSILVLLAGVATTGLSRLSALPLSGKVLRRLLAGYFLMMIVASAGLAGLLVLAALTPNAGPDRGAAPVYWLPGLALGGASAMLGLVVVGQRRRRGIVRSGLLAGGQSAVDIAARLGYRPIGAGRHQRLARLPLNEQFHVEISCKPCFSPSLPKSWDGLRILHISDLHFTGTVDQPFFEEVLRLGQETEPDLIVFTGDLIDRPELVSWLPGTLGQLSAPLGCYYVLGNHDWYCGDVRLTRRTLNELGWTDVAGQQVLRHMCQQPLLISGTERPWMGDHPDLSAASGRAYRLLLSHTPDNLAWARRQGVDLMLCGHLHGGQVQLPLLGPVYAPSIYGCRYSSGVFWEEPTLLVVSRGVSGDKPIRYRCLPELTTLVLCTTNEHSARAVQRFPMARAEEYERQNGTFKLGHR